MAKLIYAEPDDEITNLVDRLRAEKAEADLVFVLPPASRVMQSGLNARLLMQYSNSLGKQTSVVSTDPRTQASAIETGFTVYPTLTDYEARRTIDRAVQPASFASRIDDFEPAAEVVPPGPTPRRTEAPAAVPSPRSRPATTRSEVVRKRAGFLPWVLGGIGVIAALLILLFFVFPSATVTILTAARSVSATPTVTGATTPPTGPDQLAVQTTVQQSQQTTTQARNSTGKKDVPPVPATGNVVFTYATATPFAPVFMVPKGSQVSSDDGKAFITQADTANLRPGDSSSSIPVIAKVGGTAGNVGAHTIKNISNNPYPDNLKVDNADAIQGGAEATTKVVVSQTDLDSAKKDLGDQLTQKVKDELKQKAGGQKIIDETQAITVDATFDHKAGDEAGNFNANISAKGQATSFDESKMKDVLVGALKRQAPSGYTLTDDPPKLDYHVAQKDAAGMVIWDASASGFMAVAVNIDDLKKNITGQSPAKARSYILGHIDASDVVIKETPSFVPWLPFLGARIDIKEQVQNNTPQ
jgi:hypothetical protein